MLSVLRGQGRITSMISLARSELTIPVTPDQLDRDPWLLNVANGTLDLRTGKLREHRRTDLITKLAPVAYDPNAGCPTWMQFLEKVMGGDGELIAFLQRVVGYSLTGDTREQALFVLYGTGANGKSTFLATIGDLLGDYAKATPTDTLLVKPGSEGPRNDVARLKGARFVSAVEAEGGKRLAEALVKQITGGDRISARFLYGEYFEFRPEFKIFLAVNHKPVIKSTDHAIWRRIKLIPFTVTIPNTAQDKTLPAKLRAEAPGILGWAVEGCLEWQRNGLGFPTAVVQATDAYRAEMDVFAAFLNESTIARAGAQTPSSELYAAYLEWTEEAGVRFPITKQEFGVRLKERGFIDRKGSHGTRVWRGIALRDDPEEVA
jgi:putative DNA primase/helicase